MRDRVRLRMMKMIRINDLQDAIDPASTRIAKRNSPSSEGVTSHFVSHGPRRLIHGSQDVPSQSRVRTR
jgi:hypothetical protein